MKGDSLKNKMGTFKEQIAGEKRHSLRIVPEDKSIFN